MSETTLERPSDDELVHRLAAALAQDVGRLTSGDVAALRRMDPRRIDAAGFWKLEALFLEGVLKGEAYARARQETRWAAVMTGLAVLGPLHRRGARLGDALRAAGLSEVRFVRLLRADEETLLDELPSLARQLAAKGTAVDWADAARLLLVDDRDSERAERHRRALARDYYRDPDTKPSA